MPAGESSRSTVAVSDGQGTDFMGLLADLTVAVGSLSERMKPSAKPVIPWEACHPVPVLGTVQLTSGAGTLDQPDMYGPKDLYWWDFRDLGTWGFTAGTVTIFLNSTNGQQVGVATTPGEFTWSAQRLLAPRDRLIFVASGVTGNVQIGGQAIEVETAWLPTYLM